ncbi:MAG: azurin [Proteobacteria bacterium]|nr:azurin [Pseudomonadota bacterium]
MNRLWKPLALALLAGAGAHAAWAADCATEIDGNDAMQYNKSSISVPASCTKFTVTLRHTGKLPKASMGHDWVMTKTADMQAVLADGASAGLDKDYLKPGDTRVLAHTKIIGGGESDSVTFATSLLKSGGPFSYFCSFPGHVALMKGTIALSK